MKKRTITLATLMATSSVALAADPVKDLTGPNQPKNHEICMKVTPYSITDFGGGNSHFYAFVIDGSGAWPAKQDGKCEEPDYQTRQCPEGYVKLTSTVPVACNVPVAL